jgi:multidrug efflux pump subunit AcrB
MLNFALKRPVTIIVLFLGLLIFSCISLFTIPVDIFPKLNLPTIYVIEPYGGMSPRQMEGFFATRLQDQFLYITGVKSVESKNIQGLTLLKLSFYETTDMTEASAQVALQVNRAMKFFPPGALPPQVIRFDASSLPVGELVFSSKNRSLKDIYDLVTTRIRPLFSTVPGLSAPPPFGANSRSVIINVDPQKLRSYNVTPDQVVQAVAKNNIMTPSGNVRVGNIMYIATNNSLEKTVDDFNSIPIVTNGLSTVFVKDVAKVEDAADITVDYALINGKRSVYIPVVKTADASTLDVVNSLKKKLPEMKSLMPSDVSISYEFDQSAFVVNVVKSVLIQGIFGALFTGMIILLFLGNWRSCVVVVATVPISVVSSVLFLQLAGQTINLMTLSGLSLAIGILIYQSTITIENIHQHLEMGKNLKEAIYDACKEIAFPLLLILLCILAVFAPSFVMNGIPKAMFLPLSLSVGFTMIISYFAAQTLVPVLSNWMLRKKKPASGKIVAIAEGQKVNSKSSNNYFNRVKNAFAMRLGKMLAKNKQWTILYLLITIIASVFCFSFIGKDLLPRINSGQFQLRIREPDGTRLERTEDALKRTLAIIDSTVNNHIAVSSAYVGLIPSSYGTSNLYVFNTGTNEAVIQVSLDPKYHTNLESLKEELRANIKKEMPQMRLSFEPIELTEKIMSQGASTPIEVRVAGKNINDIATYSNKLLEKLKAIPYLRDVQIKQPLKVPSISIKLDRLKIAQMGLDLPEVVRSLTDATSSSRFTEKNQWLDENVAYTYQVQVQVPEYIMNEMNQLKSIPLVKNSNEPVLGEVASFSIDTIQGEYDRSGPRRFLTVSANIHNKDLASATHDVQNAINEIGTLPAGLKMEVRGMSDLLTATFSSLQTGLLAALIIILLLLAANYQSFKLSLAVLSTTPAVLLGALLMLLVTGSTLNLQSYMGIIMAIGVSVANSILIVTNAEIIRPQYQTAKEASKVSASIRLRPILMTSFAMIAGMIPMASGIGESGDQTAPLARAVIGGLAFSTFAALFIVPLVYSWMQQKASVKSVSLLPENPNE